MNNYKNGKQIREKVIGKEKSQAISDSLADIAPIIDEKILSAFDEVQKRNVISLKQREMLTLTSLATQGDTSNQLELHIRASLNIGLTKEEIVEVFVHCLPYIGFPKTLNAIAVTKKVFANSK
ncbi:carboxymuconolactone decarboxylase family protein [Leuconostoc suionicum]|uniref:carboxymuconolactone decarboxylase family protein n=1 Tax=Leuconostoc suionicum TaxID=1511761 RepID=UPI0024AE6CA2|nr:carboxymuconolactone decarboxylase family protein [Leuconostoc suionicum]MDI6523822.1 carboxymuconolactone decarboxylase family protein [Leuconostoc suionicum]